MNNQYDTWDEQWVLVYAPSGTPLIPALSHPPMVFPTFGQACAARAREKSWIQPLLRIEKWDGSKVISQVE
jgi:hypothetical protein